MFSSQVTVTLADPLSFLFSQHPSLVFLLPHLGSATLRTRTNMGLRALDNLTAFAQGKAPRDQLT